MAREFIRTDKNGTRIYHEYTCQRCNGKGVYVIGVCNNQPVLSPLDSGTCWECGGSGISPKPLIIKEYTPEYQAKLDARAAKRREKRIAERRAEHPAQKLAMGFVDDKIHVVAVENTYELREQIKAAGGRFDVVFGWYFSEPHEEFNTVEITAEEALYEEPWGNLAWRSDIGEIVEAKLPPKPVSHHIGQIGEKVELTVSHIRTGSYETRFGITHVYTFKDEAGNVLVWKTGSSCSFPEGMFRLGGSIKEHSEYNGVDQTVLTRCKILPIK